MIKHRPTSTKSPPPSTAAARRSDKRPEAAPPSDAISRHLPSSAAVRETIESVVIAFVLALLFRTFEAEAFVIPTGSMAPTLMGRHKDVVCPKCGCPYQVNASKEADDAGNLKDSSFRVVAGTCPMCRYTASFAPDNPQHKTYPSYNGDRILVSKFAYEMADPRRWDVIVFKFPGDAQADARTNFIKRLAGLPGETVWIQHGDLWIRRGQEPFQIARKPPEKLWAMLQPVFDNDYMPRIADYGWPPRWRPEPTAAGSATGAWSSDDKVTFHTDGTAPGENWLRYHHLVPDYQQWREARQQGGSPPELSPQLITDFTAYDTDRLAREENLSPDPRMLGRYWVGDLALRCTAEVESEKGELLFELRKGGRRFHCHIDVATGQATLSVSGGDMRQFRPTAATSVRGPGRHEIRFSNCDGELRLWVEGRAVEFDVPTTYRDLGNHLPEASDLSPVGVASLGVNAQLSHLALFRDIYYIADDLSSPDLRDATVRNQFERRDAMYSLKTDQFFVLGDNSAWSKDGRLWGADNYWVPRELLIGKALFLYWPHSWDKIPYVNIPFPMFPNFGRMGFVR
jgi:signal peptidase I